MKYKELEKIATQSCYSIRKDEVSTVINKYNAVCDRADVIFISELERNKITVDIVATCRRDLDTLHGAMKYANTPPDERQEEKIYTVPLPHLKTSDGKQLFLTHQGNFFPCERNMKLRQTWKEKNLIHIPEEYRNFAVEIAEVEE